MTVITGPEGLVVNCDCSDTYDSETLATLRHNILLRGGFAAQAANPPPGMADLIDSFLDSAQKYLYRRFNALRTERWFSWTLVEGVRHYDVRANDANGECTLRLDPRKVTWAGIQDEGNNWTPMTCGINPLWYTFNQQGIPSAYEIRQCIEVWPAPDTVYTMQVKGHFGLARFTEDDDVTTIDPGCVFLWALGLFKSHYNRPDAGLNFRMVNDIVSDLVAGSHHTRRYIPRFEMPPPAPRPIFLPLGSST